MEFDEALKRAQGDKPAPTAEAAPVAVVPASTPVVVVEPDPPPQMVVVARNPQQMMAAQARLIGWAARQLEEARQDHADLESNLEAARRGKWKTSTLAKHVAKALRRVVFYEKVHAALEAGYVIIPNFTLDVFAIRTERLVPTRDIVHEASTRWPNSIRNPGPQESERLPVGKGRYVAARPLVDSTIREVKPEQANPYKPAEYSVHRRAAAFDDIDFPFITAKPAILNATQEALALRLFDDVGVSPSGGGIVTRRPEVRGDPMVVGRVLIRDGTNTRAISFLISWFVDTRDLP